MEYMMSFLEGIITFISPCLLPMIPIYLSYFAGGEVASKKKETLQNASGFVIGFTIVFMLLGTFASSIGIFLKQYSQVLQIIFGVIMIVFGLNFMGMLKIKWLNRTSELKADTKNLNFKTDLMKIFMLYHYFFNYMDSLCRNIFRECLNASSKCRTGIRRNPYAIMFFHGTCHSFFNNSLIYS